jgi:hypothetical protein
MPIPHAERAVVDIRKLRDYCMNPMHDEGQHKARLFATALGMTAEDAEDLRVLLSNWLRVLGTAELPHINQGVRQQFHATMSWLPVFETQEEPLACIPPGDSPIDTSPQGMDRGMEEPLAPALGALAVAGIRWDVGDHAGIEHALAMVRGIKSSVEIQLGSCENHPD